MCNRKGQKGGGKSEEVGCTSNNDNFQQETYSDEVSIVLYLDFHIGFVPLAGYTTPWLYK